MKSINILRFLLLSTTLCLVPLVAFSSTFTSEYPIILPTNGFPVPVLPEVLDINGEPLLFDEEYRILSATWGAGSGAVDLAKIGNTRCPNAVVLQGGDTQEGLPVKFSTSYTRLSNVVRETNQITIMFSIPSTPRCDNGTFWIVGNPDLTARGLRFVVTSRVLVAPDSFFQIEKFLETSPFYKIRHCNQLGVDCKDVGLTFHRGHNRLALTNQPFFFIFKKVHKTDNA